MTCQILTLCSCIQSSCGVREFYYPAWLQFIKRRRWRWLSSVFPSTTEDVKATHQAPWAQKVPEWQYCVEQNQQAHSRQQIQPHCFWENRQKNNCKIIKGNLWESILLITRAKVEVQSVVVESWMMNPKKAENHKCSILTIVSPRTGWIEKSEWTMLGLVNVFFTLVCFWSCWDECCQSNRVQTTLNTRAEVCEFVCVCVSVLLQCACQHMEHYSAAVLYSGIKAKLSVIL